MQNTELAHLGPDKTRNILEQSAELLKDPKMCLNPFWIGEG